MGMDLKEEIIEEDEEQASNPKVVRALKRFQSWFIPEATDIIFSQMMSLNLITCLVLVLSIL